jgi:tetratricopeptide (TPR) repeat protein
MRYAAATREADLWHAAFLRRLAGAPSSDAVESRLGQGAFLVLRLVDLLEYQEPAYGDAFHYQHAAAERFCHELPGDRTETAHLIDLIRSAAAARHEQDVRLVLPALLAYGHHLEDELRLAEALDVLETAVRVGGAAFRPADAIAVRLRTARVLRKLNAFDQAEELYGQAEALATTGGDRHSLLLSRIGRAYTPLGRGNLLEAERRLLAVLEYAEACGDRYGQALAHQGLGVVLSTGGRATDAIPHTWRAFELYEDDLSRARALGDLGTMLLIVGDAVGAERALTEVVRRGTTHEVVSNAMIELMHCASYRRDRVGFERWRERCEARVDRMPGNMRVDFQLKAGVGRARFGQFDRAEALLTSALNLAEAAGLHEFVFRIERIKAGLRDCQEEVALAPEAIAESALQSDGVRDVSRSVAQLAR